MRGFVGTVVAASVLALLTGCDGTPERNAAPRSVVDDVAADGDVCPQDLPKIPDDEYGFGTDDPADSLPNPGRIERAWICSYLLLSARDVWHRRGGPVPVEDEDLAELRDGVRDLEVPPEEYSCTEELGPRYLVVTERAGGDRTGYAVDDFGCDAVRITDDPVANVAGEPQQEGTVRGVLFDGTALVALAHRYDRDVAGG